MTNDNAAEPVVGRIIKRLHWRERIRVLDEVAARTQGELVRVEHATDGPLAEAAGVVGHIVGVALDHGTRSSIGLVVRPADPSLRLVVIPDNHVMRVRRVVPWGRTRPGAYRVLEVIAGPPARRAS
ncbi:hypothetical protein [Aeromicrobium sp. Leaf291]|uniref:hypothetical protein n=1 Tax=Aeromicrobium sp. Leaf291 TaxID=1736325 RepID=UPI0006F26B5D|nr:hypothetical protein [Aeromicrobium sp. Leaf291]KQP81589.1 hypothetical protein ASF35_16290 [Aeromicrobium sp. Leaf291]